MKETFTGRVRAAVEDLAILQKWEFSLQQLYDKVGVQTYEQRRQVRSVVADMCKSGELERVGEGVYRLLQRPAGKPQIQEVMWRVLRARRTVTLADMEELAGAAPTYATEWFKMLSRRKIVRHLKNGSWQMVKDPGPTMPLNDEKAERLRKMRAKKKEALACMDRAFVAIAEARMAMSEMEE
jgi:predicted transcriptional regulator of viral defense system